MTGDTHPDLPAALSAVAIRSYMRNSGWRESTQGTVGSVWTKGDAKFCVPHEGDDPELIQRALVRLASTEGRTPEETAAAIAAHRDAGSATKDCGCGPLEPCGEHLGRGAVASVSTSAVTSPAPAPAEHSGTATGPAKGVEAALGRVAKLAESWAALAITGTPVTAAKRLADEIDAYCGRVLLDVIHGPSGAEVRLSRVTALAESWMAADGLGLFYPAAGQAFLDAIGDAGAEEAAGWRQRAERAEAKLAEVRQTIATFFTHHGGQRRVRAPDGAGSGRGYPADPGPRGAVMTVSEDAARYQDRYEYGSEALDYALGGMLEDALMSVAALDDTDLEALRKALDDLERECQNELGRRRS